MFFAVERSANHGKLYYVVCIGTDALNGLLRAGTILIAINYHLIRANSQAHRAIGSLEVSTHGCVEFLRLKRT